DDAVYFRRGAHRPVADVAPDDLRRVAWPLFGCRLSHSVLLQSRGHEARRGGGAAVHRVDAAVRVLRVASARATGVPLAPRGGEMTARLLFRNIGRTFQAGRETTVAVRGINLSFERGSFTAMVGRSGCGKSTLLHIAAGLDTEYEGSFAREPTRATLACPLQQPRLLLWQSARITVAFVQE